MRACNKVVNTSESPANEDSRVSDEIVVIMHKAMFVESMTGRRTFITNINERADELGMRENMKRVGHNKIQTHLDYQHDRQTGRVVKPVSLFDVGKIKPSKAN